MCILNKSQLPFKELDKLFGKTEGYFISMRSNSPTRFFYIFSFSKNRFESVYMYMNYVNKLFHNASILESQLTKNELIEILYEVGYSYSTAHYDFTRIINQIIDEETILSVQFQNITKVIKFCDFCYKRGYRIWNM